LPKVSRGLAGILLIAASLLSAATGVTTSVATAADLASIYYGGPAPYFAFSWAEPYVGAALGNEWGSIDDNPTRPNGFAGGPETGFNRQNGSLVHGSAADIGFSAADDTFAPWQFSNPWFGTMRGRAGGAINMLPFGAAGFAYGEPTESTSGNLSASHAILSWAGGFSTEAGFAKYESAKAEWLYLELVDRHFSEITANNGLAANLVRLGLNYHF
jgi:outer membrane immunogenic protein